MLHAPAEIEAIVKSLRTWQKQGKRYQCLYENASGQI